MASPLVERFRNDTAPRLLARFGNGGVSTVVRVRDDDADPLAPPEVTETTAEVNAFAKGISAQMLAADPNLQVTDLRVIVAAVDYAPKVGDTVEINGTSRLIIRVDAIPAAGDPAVYWFYAR